jgi:DNA polymerase-3 subunit delta'
VSVERSNADWGVIGHGAAVDALAQAIRRDRVRHAYIFSGADGLGKTTLARRFAQVLLCQDRNERGEPCHECRSCRKIERGVHPDVQTFSLESQAAMSGSRGTKNTTLTIETVRELSSTASLRPMEGRWRVILVEDAETLQGIAQEAFLKTLEEPPAYLVLILLANDLELLLPTIRSRCQMVELRRVRRSAIEDGLVLRGASAEKAQVIASLAGGAPGWAFRALTDSKLLQQREESLTRAIEWIGGSGRERLVRAVRIGDSFTKKRSETFSDLDTLLGVWRDALLLHADQNDYLTFRGQRAEIADLVRPWSLESIHRAVRAVQACIVDLEANVRPRLALEAMVLQWPIKQASLRG